MWPFRQYTKSNINKSRTSIFIRANLKEQIRLINCKIYKIESKMFE